MTNTSAKTIDAEDHSLFEILTNKKYTVDYFQREYRWRKDNIEQMLSDLEFEFNNNFQIGHNVEDVEDYRTYFMGTIVLSRSGNTYSIIDGQQRLTSLTLLLIYLYHRVESDDDLKNKISDMIYSSNYGKKSFNINVQEREGCWNGLFTKEYFDASSIDDASVKNMVERYNDITNAFPEDDFESEDKLISFGYWVINKIILVQIVATESDNAYTIFETMNDRGLSLTPSDMLKGFILSKFRNDQKRAKVNEMWKKDMLCFAGYDDEKDVDAQFFQSWLRSQFAETIRESSQGAVNQDFENIGVRFHNWFKDNYEKGLLRNSINNSIEDFVENNYKFFFQKFILIKNAELSFDEDLQHVFYIKYWGIAPTLTYPLLLAPLCVSDLDDVCKQKIDIVAKYIDGFVVRRSVNFKQFGASSIRYTMCNLVKSIRGKSIDELKKILSDNTSTIENEFNFDGVNKLTLHGQNRRFIKYFLCRLTSYIDKEIGNGNQFNYYINNPQAKPFEIEHIWSNHPEWHKDEISQDNEFSYWRNNIGDLVLLPNGSNQSYNDLPAKDKIPHYAKENILAKSLTDIAYQNNPNFENFIKKNSFGFTSYQKSFKLQEIQDRARLYASLAKKIWSKDF